MINPQTGLVSIGDMTMVSTNSASQDYVPTSDPNYAADGLAVSRRLARESQSMGDR